MRLSRAHGLLAVVVLAVLALCVAAPLVAAAKARPPAVPKTASGSATVNKSCDIPSGLDPTGLGDDICDSAAGGLPDVPSPRQIAELPEKAASDVLNGLKNDVVSAMTTAVAKAASWLLGKTLDAITSSTTPDVTASWFTGQYGQMAALAALFAIPFLVLAAIQSVAATDWGILARAAFVEVPLAFIFTAMAVGVTALLLAVTDGMSDWITHSSQAHTEAFVKSMVTVYAATGTLAVPPFLALVAAITAVMGAFLVWLELIVREAGIYICLAFVPFVMAARIWPRVAHWCRRLVETGVVIIFSKFAIAAIFAIAAAALGQVGQAKDLRAVFAGAALVLLAAFAPYALLKLVPMAEGAVSAMGGHRQQLQAAPTTGPLPSPAALMQDQMRSGFMGTAAGSGTAAGGGQTPAVGGKAAAGGEAAAGGAGAAAAGPAALAVVGAQVAKEAATAGPKAGGAFGGHADQMAGSSTGGGGGGHLTSYDGQTAGRRGVGGGPENPAGPLLGDRDASEAPTIAQPPVSDDASGGGGDGGGAPSASPPVGASGGGSLSGGGMAGGGGGPARPTPADVASGPGPDVQDPAQRTEPATPPPPNALED